MVESSPLEPYPIMDEPDVEPALPISFTIFISGIVVVLLVVLGFVLWPNSRGDDASDDVKSN